MLKVTELWGRITHSPHKRKLQQDQESKTETNKNQLYSKSQN